MIQENIAAIVKEFEHQYAAAFNRRDALALVALFTEDVTIVTEWGDVVTGRAAFAQGLKRAFAVVPANIIMLHSLFSLVAGKIALPIFLKKIQKSFPGCHSL